jgi:NADH:ubiquinone oxidoreductase subunit 5 (subunit L)/multisubunit Na+/H+ antiporter MnhA subunit
MYISVVLFPLFSFFISFFFARYAGGRGTWFLNFVGIFYSLLLASEFFFVTIYSNFKFSILNSTFFYFNFSSVFDFSWSFKMDFISIVMVFLICLISAFIQIFSSSYMQQDPSFSRFMIYMSFFSFSILLLVTSSNLLILFLGWEIVGLASVLLINFWFNRQEANWGSLKAFFFNRVGDAAIILAIVIFYFSFNSLDFDTIEINIYRSSNNFVFFGFFLILVSAFAKSAQFFFQSWLPDAMEGPTPVSALLHSATMVTAGVYLTIRFWESLSFFPFFQTMICVLGLITSFYSAFVLTTVNNAKHTTAYTTLNQLGFIFYAAGSLCFSTALFHLFIHGLYKSFTFLENAIELSILDDEQEGAIGFFNGNSFESFYDIFGFLVFLSVNALPFSSPSVSKEVLIFSGFETISNFISFFLLSIIFIGFIDSCYDDFFFEFSSFNSLNFVHFISSPFAITFSYFTLGLFSFFGVFFTEDIFLSVGMIFGDFYTFSIITNGSSLLFVPFFAVFMFSFFFPSKTIFVSSNFYFKTYLSNLFFYDFTLINFVIKNFFSLFFSIFKTFDRGLFEIFFIQFTMSFVFKVKTKFFNISLNFFSKLFFCFASLFFSFFFFFPLSYFC